MVNDGIFMSIWYNLWPFDIVCGHLLYIFPIWYVWTKKNLATLELMITGQMTQKLRSHNYINR
jgi:hypothetical protein